MQRLLKAYRIMVETKNPNSFDANYKAIICYNLACCCQMQGELPECSKYLTKAIEFLGIKLVHLKEGAVTLYYQLNQDSAGQGTQEASIITASSISTNVQKQNVEILDKKLGKDKNQKALSSAKNPNRMSQGQLTGQQNYMSRYAPGTSSSKNVQSATKPNPYAKGRSPPLNGGNKAKGLGSTQTSLFSEFNRFANANQRQKASQQSLRTMTGAQANKRRSDVHSAAHGAKGGAGFGTQGGSRPPTSKGTRDAAQTSSAYKQQRQDKNHYQSLGGQPTPTAGRGPNLNQANAKLKQKKEKITRETWLDCYKHSSTKTRPPRETLERAIHMTRHHCRFVLQLCAVLSQLNEHENALEFSKKAS